MKDIVFFITQGWKNIWRQRTIWLFSVISLFLSLGSLIKIEYKLNLFWLIFSLLELTVILVLSIVSSIGIPYLAYCFSIGNIVTFLETLSATRNFFWRFVGSSILVFLVVSPFICWVLISSINNSTFPQFSDKALLLLFPLSLFSAMWDFTIFGFFAYDLNIRQSFKKAWILFFNHFSHLVVLGFARAIIIRIYLAVSVLFAVFIQSGFDLPTLSKLNLINPAVTLDNNILFILLSGIFTTIFLPFSASVFALAYLKYTK